MKRNYIQHDQYSVQICKSKSYHNNFTRRYKIAKIQKNNKLAKSILKKYNNNHNIVSKMQK